MLLRTPTLDTELIARLQLARLEAIESGLAHRAALARLAALVAHATDAASPLPARGNTVAAMAERTLRADSPKY